MIKGFILHMQLYNTLTRATETLKPLQDNTVRMYSCGPTVYDHAHIGNLSAYIFADTLRRTIQLAGYGVRQVMNYTDVDDKTIQRSRELYPDEEPRAALHKLTNRYIDAFLKDMRLIGNDTSAVTFVRATESVQSMQELVTDLYRQGFAYIADDGVYFSIEAYRKAGKTYGQLLELTTQNTSAARIQNDEYDKDSAHDFALWKKQKPGEPAWDFTLNGHDLKGRPGWHIECSAMSRGQLGQPFDIHTGGIDLVFPHHENEIAQSTADTNSPVMAAFFAHNAHILVDGKKMSKSAHNFYTLQDIIAKGYDPLAFRLMVLQAHYRSQVNFTWESLAAAQNRLKALQAMADLRWQARDETAQIRYYDTYLQTLLDYMQNDINTPMALKTLNNIADDINEELDTAGLKDFVSLLQTIDALFGLRLLESADILPGQKQLIAEREKARDSQNWTYADKIRYELESQGLALRDTPHGTLWSRG